MKNLSKNGSSETTRMTSWCLSDPAFCVCLGIGILTTHYGHKGMTDGFEEEEIVVDRDLDEHHHACSDDIEKGDYVDGSENVEDHVTWTSQGFGEVRHDF